MVSPFLSGAVCEGRRSCLHQMAICIEEVVAGIDVRAVEVADGVIAVFQMTLGA